MNKISTYLWGVSISFILFFGGCFVGRNTSNQSKTSTEIKTDTITITKTKTDTVYQKGSIKSYPLDTILAYLPDSITVSNDTIIDTVYNNQSFSLKSPFRKIEDTIMYSTKYLPTSEATLKSNGVEVKVEYQYFPIDNFKSEWTFPPRKKIIKTKIINKKPKWYEDTNTLIGASITAILYTFVSLW